MVSRFQQRGLFIMKKFDTDKSKVGRLETKKAAMRRLSFSLRQRTVVNTDFSVKRATMERIWIQSKDRVESNLDLLDDEGHAITDSAADRSMFRLLSFGRKINT